MRRIRSLIAAVILLTMGCIVLCGASAVETVPEALAKHAMVSATTGAQAVGGGALPELNMGGRAPATNLRGSIVEGGIAFRTPHSIGER